MAAALIAISFICAILLAVFVPVKRVYSDIPALAIVLWLALANVLRGVNSSLFDGTVAVKSFVWCDISTKLLLGVNVAIPCAFICIGRRMELLSSSRKIFDNATVRRNSILFELVMCYIVPLIYMALHLLAQHHRFDIIQDFGCFAAIHPSTPGVVLVWVLPLLIGAVSLLMSSIALKHSLSMPKAIFANHLEDRSTAVSASLFIRRVATSIAMSCITIITTIFSLFAVPKLIPWKSWAWAHAFMSHAVVLAPADISNTRFQWWSLLAVSVVYILLSFAFGEEARDSFKWLRDLRMDSFTAWFRKLFTRQPRLPRHKPRQNPPSPTGSLPHMVDLRSGWDDMVDFRPAVTKSTWSRGAKSVRSDATSPTSSRSPSAASFRGEPNSSGAPMSNEDRAFMDSTLSYLVSPPAQTLGITSPPRNSPSPFRPSPPSPTLAVPALRRPLTVVIADPVLPHATELTAPVSTQVRSPSTSRPNISAVIHAEWPVPPETPSPAGSLASRHSRAHSPDHSPSSSIEEIASYISHVEARSVSPVHLNSRHDSRPFGASYANYTVSLGSMQSVSAASLSKPAAAKSPSLKQSIQSLRESWTRDRQRHTSAQSHQEGIIMTVVQETV